MLSTINNSANDAQSALIGALREHFDEATVTQVLSLLPSVRKAADGIQDGEEHLIHALEAASVLANMHSEVAAVQASLLVDLESMSTEFEPFSQEVIDPRVESLVREVQRIRALPYLSSGAKTTWSESRRSDLYHAFVSALEEPLPLVIELAIQLSRLRHVNEFHESDLESLAHDALLIYAPLAHRLGVRHIKWRLEDRAFRHINPEAYHAIANTLNQQRDSRDEIIDRLCEELVTNLNAHGINAQVTGRPKHIFSIYRKMQRKGVPLEQVYDIRALRVLVDTESACYEALSVVHRLWNPIPGELDDYVSNPKPNGYQSLHTAVIDPEGETLEVQIRTEQMHADAELGIASHWSYKERGGSRRISRKKKEIEVTEALEIKISALRSFLYESADDTIITSERVPIVSTGDDRPAVIFVATPQGDLIRLPAGATPIDFAYRIHTELGHRCYRAFVNGSVVPLDHELHAGDIVEISTRNRGGPNPNWLSKDNRFVKTKDARKKIAHYFRAQMKETLIRKGHEIVDRELSSQGLKSLLSYDQVAVQLGLSTSDELKQKLGSGEISLERLRAALMDTPSLSKEEMAREADQVLLESKGESAVLIDKAIADDRTEPDIADEGFTIASTTGLMSKIGQCCYPLPYEDIVGFVTRGHGVTIHRTNCPNVTKNIDQDRIVPAEWGKSTSQGFRTQIVIEALNRKGLIADVGQVVARENMDITEAHAVKRAHWAVFELLLEVTDLDQLDLVMDKILQTSGVRSAHRKLG